MYNLFLKRGLDIMGAIILVPIAGIIITLTGLLIWLEDRGPIFYNGKRLGKGGKVFVMYKLRTMKVNAPDIRNKDGTTFNSSADPRLTRVGRLLRQTSIDELPQIFNVIKGDMSFVGPRPDFPEHIAYYGTSEVRKLSVLPGITGFNQAFFRNSVPWDVRLKNDVFYADNVTIYLDLKIVIQTIIRCVGQKGIYVPNKTGVSNYE
jgi:lipopolysaccharide/colanic/teichoic acid biosynthesis glycosyltransferase